MVAIQLKEIGAIDQDTYLAWSKLSASRLAYQFGWHTEYAALVAQSKTPRAPQALLTRAIEGYRWSLVTPAAIARLKGRDDPRIVAKELEAEDIVPRGNDDVVPERPKDVGDVLTPEELALLMSDID